MALRTALAPRHPLAMFSLDQRIRTAFDLSLARRRAAECAPFSPSWDAAIAQVEDLEREMCRLGRAAPRIAAIDAAPLHQIALPAPR
jgi:hypothetical protein